MKGTRGSGAQSRATEVSWAQVAAFRMGRHHLSARAPRQKLVATAGEMAGAQAQLVTAAQMSLWARVRDLEAADVDAALWDQRSLVRVWCMRRTLYLVPSTDVSIFVRGSAARADKEIRWLLNRGFPPARLDGILEAAVEVLERPRTRNELAKETAERLGVPTLSKRGGGWGQNREIPCIDLGAGEYLPAYYLLHLVGARDVLCSGPTRDGEATFVRAGAWISGWRDRARSACEEELLRRYLRAFGPATPADFRAWTSMRAADVKAIWARVEAELAPVHVAGWDAWALRRDLGALSKAPDGETSIRLLPYFDAYLLGHDSRRHLLPSTHHGRVYRPQGWVAPSMLVDGRVAGVWTHRVVGPELRVRLAPFQRLGADVVARAREEAGDLGRFLGAGSVRFEVDRLKG